MFDTTALPAETEIPSPPAADLPDPLRRPCRSQTAAHGVTAERESAFQEPTAGDHPADRILIEPLATISGDRGQWYAVHHAGAVLVERTWNPEFDAARALAAKGVTGRIQMRRPGKSHPDSAFVVEKVAQLTIAETELSGPRIVPWRPFNVPVAADDLAAAA
jgi:hypothetical protein